MTDPSREELLAALDRLDAKAPLGQHGREQRAAVALARTVIEGHRKFFAEDYDPWCLKDYCDWPCPDYTAAVAFIDATGALGQEDR